ncbi:unnamed protein product [Alternaria alternata]
MPIHTLDDTNRPKAGNSNIGRWFTEWTPKFKPAPPETKPTQTDKATTRKPAKNKRKISAKRPAKIAKSEDYDHDDGDDYYVPSEYDQDSDSDASSIMSVVTRKWITSYKKSTARVARSSNVEA